LLSSKYTFPGSAAGLLSRMRAAAKDPARLGSTHDTLPGIGGS
jgi:hypothetical protein